MKTTLQISIKDLCQQAYDSFSSTNLGGFCLNCNKEVIDFTGMTENELIHYFSRINGDICGRFLKGQLKTYETKKQGAMNNFLPKTAGIAGFSLLALCATPSSFAQDAAIADVSPKEQNDPITKRSGQVVQAQRTYTAKGVVLDEENQPLPGVNVVLRGTTTGTQTDFEGKFTFPKKLDEGDVLVFSYLGYETKTYKVKTSASTTKDISIQFKASDVTLLGAVVVGGVHKSKRTFFQKIGDLFR